MPIYQFACKCGHSEEAYRTVDNRDDAPFHCDSQMERVVVAPSMITPDIQPYQSMVDGSMIMGRKQHREHLKRHSLMEVGNETKHLKGFGDYKSPPGLKEELIRNLHRVKDEQRRKH